MRGGSLLAGLCAAAIAVTGPTPAAAEVELLSDRYADSNDSSLSPEIDSARLSVYNSDPDLLVVAITADGFTYADMTVQGFVGVRFDVDLDGVADFAAITPEKTAMVENQQYTSPLYRVEGTTGKPTSTPIPWERLADGYIVVVPWRLLGWSRIRWGAAMSDGTTIDYAPGQLSNPLSLTGASKPTRVKGVKVKRTSKAAVVRWRPDPAATRYVIRLGVNGSKPRVIKRTAKTRVRVKTRSGARYRMKIRGKGPGGLGPWKTVRFRGK